MKVYIIYHDYDVDGGYGDATDQHEILWICKDEEEAKAYIERWNKPEVYDNPYDSLYKNALHYEEHDLYEHITPNMAPTERVGTFYGDKTMYEWLDETGML